MLRALYQIALDEIDSAHPQRGGRLRVLHGLAAHLQAQPVRALDLSKEEWLTLKPVCLITAKPVLYAANVAAIVLATVALILVGRRRGLTDATPRIPGLIAHSLAVAAVFVVSIPIAYRFGPDTAKWSWLSLVVVSPLVDVAIRRR